MNTKRIIIITLVLVLAVALTVGLAACKKDVAPSPAPAVDDGGNEPSNPSTPTPDAPTAQYHISFYTGEGASQVAKMTGLTAGQTIAAPEDPSLARHTFDGWYTDYGTFQNKYEFDKMPSQNLVLYAKWLSNIGDDALAEYEAELKKESVEGHFYLHYMRFNNTPEDYEPLNLWVWPYQQTGRVFDWLRDEEGKVIVDDIAGATCDVDLTAIYTDAGKEEDETMQFLIDAVAGSNYQAGAINNESNYMNPRLGFLIVYKDSKDSGTHWRSDGNADQLFNLKDALWDNGSVHVFCVQDNVMDFVYHITEQAEIVNPYENDDGTHVSVSNVDSSQILKVQYGTSLGDSVTGVGYQIMVSSFADSDGDGMGDIRGIIQNLDYIRALNVDVLWLTPIQLSDSYHGYDIIDYKAVDPKFGTLDDYKELLTLCHELGIKVIMDLVLNHTSTNNVWFQKSTKLVVEDGIDYRNFYQWRYKTDPILRTANGELNPNWYQYSEYDYYYYGKFSPSMPELNYDNQATRDAIADVAKYWLSVLGDGKGVDGFRIDAVKHIYMADEADAKAGDIIIADYDEATETDYSSNLTKNINFFTWLADTIKAEYPNTYLVGENFDGHAYNVAPYYTAFDGMLDFYMYYNMGDLAAMMGNPAYLAGGNTSSEGSLPKGTNTDKLRTGEWDYEAVLGTEMAYSDQGLASGKGSGNNTVIDSIFTSNHDILRLVNYIAQSNSNVMSASNAAEVNKYAKAVIAAEMLLPGISWIYYGDELGMSSNFGAGESEKSPHADRQYRQPFKWTTKDYDEGGSHFITHFSISGDKTFKVEWDNYNETLAGVSEQSADTGSFLNTVRYWTHLKSTDDVIRYGSYAYKPVVWDGGHGATASMLFAFTRTYNGTTYWCITNFDRSDYILNNIFASGDTLVAATSGASMTSLPGGATIVVKIAG